MGKPVAAIFYKPDLAPSDPKDLGRYVERELEKISQTVALLSLGHIDVTYVAPERFKEGDFRLAAGTLEGAHWDPDSSGDRALYQYRRTGASTFDWVKIG
jgi:hypothetical protein